MLNGWKETHHLIMVRIGSGEIVNFRDYAVIGLIAFAGGAIIALILNANDKQEQDLLSFTNRCDQKGGITIPSFKEGKTWIGCYTGLTEIENE